MIHVGAVLAAAALAAAGTAPTTIIHIRSKDGTMIAAECAGSGPSMLIVHGGTGDRRRWAPLLPLFAARFNVCAMDRRGFGDSTDAESHSLRKEAEDVAAVAKSRPGRVFVLGHSYGAVCALEAAFLTDRIAKLALYEPPVEERVDDDVISRIDAAVAAGRHDEAADIFFAEVVKFSPEAIAAMKARPSWADFARTMPMSVRQMRAVNSYRLEPGRLRRLKVPTLLLTGSETRSPSLKAGIAALRGALPESRVYVFAGQEHNAMDTAPAEFVRVVSDFVGSR